MSKQLATAVHITDDSGVVHSFLPGTTPPKWARKRIDNPKAWAEDSSDESSDAADESEGTDEEDQDSTDESDDASGDESSDASSTATVDVPKKNASRDAWAAYADSKGFEIDDDVKRADIIAALTANGIPVE